MNTRYRLHGGSDASGGSDTSSGSDAIGGSNASDARIYWQYSYIGGDNEMDFMVRSAW